MSISTRPGKHLSDSPVAARPAAADARSGRSVRSVLRGLAAILKLVQRYPELFHAFIGTGVAWKQIAYLADTYAATNQNPAIYDGTDNTIRDLLSPEYGLYDKLNWFRGLLTTLDIVYPQLWQIDFRTQATQLQVPVYFLIGRYDINAPVTLTEEYARLLDAPHTQIVWFEHSGHTPWTREPDRFVDVVVNTVLQQTQPPR